MDGTVTRVDAASGRGAGAPLPAGPAPWQLTAGPGGDVLVLSSSARHPGQLTHLLPTGQGWTTRTVRLAVDSRADVLLAGAGGRYAVAGYTPAGGADPHAMMRLPAGGARPRRGPRRAAPHGVAPGESRFGLALADSPTGTVVYAGLWRGRRPRAGQGAGPSSPSTPRPGPSCGGRPGRRPRAAGGGPRAGGRGRRLYAVEGWPGPEARSPEDERWRLLGLDPTTLATEAVHPVRGDLPGLVVAPDGEEAYALEGARRLLRLDLHTGAVTVLATLPGQGVASLAATERWVFAPHSFGGGGAVWAIDRRSGRLDRTVAVGRSPVALTLSP